MRSKPQDPVVPTCPGQRAIAPNHNAFPRLVEPGLLELTHGTYCLTEQREQPFQAASDVWAVRKAASRRARRESDAEHTQLVAALRSENEALRDELACARSRRAQPNHQPAPAGWTWVCHRWPDGTRVPALQQAGRTRFVSVLRGRLEDSLGEPIPVAVSQQAWESHQATQPAILAMRETMNADLVCITRERDRARDVLESARSKSLRFQQWWLEALNEHSFRGARLAAELRIVEQEIASLCKNESAHQELAAAHRARVALLNVLG